MESLHQQFIIGGRAEQDVAVGEEKGVVGAEVFLDLAHAGGGHRFLAGVGESDGPVFLVVVRMKLDGGRVAQA